MAVIAVKEPCHMRQGEARAGTNRGVQIIAWL